MSLKSFHYSHSPNGCVFLSEGSELRKLTPDLIINEQFYDILVQKRLVLMMNKEEGKWEKREEKNQSSL